MLFLATALAAGLAASPVGNGAAANALASTPDPTALTVDRESRRAVISFFDRVYRKALETPANWTGSVQSCTPGETDPAYRRSTLSMVNYFRAMAGLPGDVVLDESLSRKAQEAALMMIANARLSHFPPTSWRCYTADGAAAAGKSNIALGQAGAEAVVGYMRDSGSSNTAVGHRRWILFPPQRRMGTGSTDARNGLFAGSNTLWVIADFGDRPSAPEWVSWPPAGIVPVALVFERWSLSRGALPGAEFGGAEVVMKQGNRSIPVRVLPVRNGFGDNTLVWEPQGLSLAAGQRDQTIRVLIRNVAVDGVQQDVEYSVTVIDPARTLVAQSGLGLYAPAAGNVSLIEKITSSPELTRYRLGPRRPGRLPVAGDWYEDGRDVVALYDQSKATFLFEPSALTRSRIPMLRFRNQSAGWRPLAGNWDGKHGATVGLYNPETAQFILKTANRSNAKTIRFKFGRRGANWLPVAGDWDGDGGDSIGLYNPEGGRFLLKNINRPGRADIAFRFGPKSSSRIPVAGDWDGNGVDTVGLYDPASGRFWLKTKNRARAKAITLRVKPDGRQRLPLAGNWDP